VFLRRIRIRNYKSLKDVELRPHGLTTLIGPNGSGKTNCADAVIFLSEAYQHGLEMAIARKGGYENIAFRRGKRSTADIGFSVEAFFPATFVDRIIASNLSHLRGATYKHVVVHHTFAFRATGQGIKAAYKIRAEKLGIKFFEDKPRADDSNLVEHIVVERDNPNELAPDSVIGPFAKEVQRRLERLREEEDLLAPGQDELLGFSLLPHMAARGSIFIQEMSRIAVFHFAPEICKGSGVPTPNPRLTRHGENLPALVDWLKRNRPSQWEHVISAMRDVVPGLEDISVQYTHNRQMNLSFEEEGIRRPWISEDVSDGTIHALAVLTSLADPNNSALFIEEPENSLHPWILRLLIERMRDAARKKTVIMTTHSPYVIDMLRPEETWVVSRQKGATRIQHLPEIEEGIVEQWKDGDVRLSEFFDAGLVPSAVPGGEL